MQTLPKSGNVTPPHDLAFPYNVRLALGAWKLLYLSDEPRTQVNTADTKLARGQYLVEGPGHCGECHTPRNWFGATEPDRFLAGNPHGPDGKPVPNITPDPQTGIGKWTEQDITTLLKTGQTPEFDFVGGAMGEVVRHTSRLDDADRRAIAVYLKSLPPVASQKRGR
jgi:mono/diheme cytochrome c family protein